MPSGNATQKAIQVKYFHLNQASDFIPLMNNLFTVGHESHLHATTDSGANSWQLEIVDARPGADANPGTKHKFATLGDVVIWDNVAIVVMRNETFQTNYTVP